MFSWLRGQSADEMVILGDFTVAKDRHSAVLVNRLFDSIVSLLDCYDRVILLKGNHDCLAPEYPFLRFIGTYDRISFISDPQIIDLSVGRTFFVPALTKWSNLEFPEADYLMTHATFSGAKAETGFSLTGVDPLVLDGFNGEVVSGDVHVPQTMMRGKLTYVGAPYHVRFGDCFDPRLLLIGDTGNRIDLEFPAPRKHTFSITRPEDLMEEGAAEGDHVKVKCLLKRSDYSLWPSYRTEIRSIVADRGWRLFGAEPVTIGDKMSDKSESADLTEAVLPDDLVVDYARRHKASADYLKAGRRFLSG